MPFNSKACESHRLSWRGSAQELRAASFYCPDLTQATRRPGGRSAGYYNGQPTPHQWKLVKGNQNQMKRKMRLTIETEQSWVIRGGKAERRAKCDRCGEIVSLISTDEAAILAQLDSRAINGLIESEDIHLIETGDELLLICSKSICHSLARTDTRITTLEHNAEDFETT